jgi:hypothetical protein
VLGLVGIGVAAVGLMALQVLLPSLAIFGGLGFGTFGFFIGGKLTSSAWLSDRKIIEINEADQETIKKVCIDLIFELNNVMNVELKKLYPVGLRTILKELKIDISTQKTLIKQGKVRVLSSKVIERLIQKINAIYKEKMIKDSKLKEGHSRIIRELSSYYDLAAYIRRTKTGLTLKDSGVLYKRVALIENLRQVFPRLKGIPLKDISFSYLIFEGERAEIQLGQFLNKRIGRKSSGSKPWIMSRVNPSVLFGMDYKIQKLTLQHFRKVGLDIDLSKLEQVKLGSSQVIKEFVMMNPYSIPYVVYETSSGNAINKELIYEKYEFIRSLYFAFCEEYGSILTFGEIDKITKEKFGIRWSLGDYLTTGSDFGTNKLRDLTRIVKHFKDSTYKSEALEACKTYTITLQQTTISMVGDFAHYCFEFFTIDYINSLDIDASADYELALPNDRQIDNVIEWNSEVKARMNDIYGIDPDKYKAIMVDYTMASKPLRVLGKLAKGYQSSDRFLFIVLYAKKSSKTVTKLQNALIEMTTKDPSLKSVKIITLEEYLQFLGVGEKYYKLFDDINNLVTKANSRDSGAFDQLEKLMRKYQSALLAHDQIDFFYRYLGWANKI